MPHDPHAIRDALQIAEYHRSHAERAYAEADAAADRAERVVSQRAAAHHAEEARRHQADADARMPRKASAAP